MSCLRCLAGIATLLMAGCGGDDASDGRAGSDAGADATTDTDSGAMDASMDTGADSGAKDAGADVADADVSDTGVDAPTAGPCVAPRIGLSFSIDDTANGTYGGADGLAWKGSFSFDLPTNTLVYDAAWSGPYPQLFDDGPVSTGGHEVESATAGDSIFGAIVCYEPDATHTFEYGAIRGSVAGSDGEWIWIGENGKFTVNAGTSADVMVPPLVIPAFGDVDLRLTLDTAALDPLFLPFNPTNGVAVKGAFTTWTEVSMVDDGSGADETAGDGVYTFALSGAVGAGTPFPHSGLLHSGTDAEFLFVVGGVEYKDATFAGATAGAAAATQSPASSIWAAQPILVQSGGSQNLYVSVP